MTRRQAVCGAWVLSSLVGIVPLRADDVPGDPVPADARPHDFDMKHIRLTMSVDFEKESVDAQASIELAPREGVTLSQVALDAVDFSIQKVVCGEKEVGFRHDGKTLSIPTDGLSVDGNPLELVIHYRIEKPKKGVYFIQPTPEEPESPRQVYTQSEPDETRFWLPCFDQPDDKVTSETIVTVPSGMLVLSNGALVSKTESSEAGTATFHWAQEIPHSVYLIVVTAGNYVKIEDRCGDLPLEYYVAPDEAPYASLSFSKTASMIEYFSEKTGVEYPYEKYAQITVRRYMWGGMEHTTATTLNADTIHDERSHLDWDSDGLVAHELSHMWFGDLVTCKTWAHLWLNESFATYFAILWTEKDEGVDEARLDCYHTRNGYFGEARDGKVQPIVYAEYKSPYDVFDSHRYNKGSQVLHMLRFVLGDEVFFRGIRVYLEENRAKSVTTARLQRAFEIARDGRAEGQLSWFFDQWVAKPGHPVLKVESQWNGEKKVVHLVVEQTQDTEKGIPIFLMPVDVTIHAGKERTTHRIEISKRRDEFDLPASEAPQGVFFDHGHWLLAEIDFPRSVPELLYQAEKDEDAVGRYLAVGGLVPHVASFQVVDALARVMKSDAVEAVRSRAAEVLAERKDDLALYHLLVGLEDPASGVREPIAARLDWFGVAKVEDRLRKLASEDRSYSVINSAAKSLAEAKAEGAYEFLLELTRADSFRERLREGALEALIVLGDKRAIDPAFELAKAPHAPGVRTKAYELLVKLSPEREDVVDFLTTQLQETNHRLRGAAADQLAELGRGRSLPILKARAKEESIERTRKRLEGAIEKLEKKLAGTTEEAVRLREEEFKVREERMKVAEERLGVREKMLELRQKELDLEAKELELRQKELELREKAAKK